MSLKIYTKKSDIPKTMKFINYNDKFFNSTFLSDSEVSRRILKEIDHADYNSKDTFVGRDVSIGALNKSYLSTGCKTLLNILANPDICFDVIECGQNALRAMLGISDGNVLWEYPVIIVSEAVDCDVSVNGKNFRDTMKLAEYFTNLMMGEEQ